MSSEPLGGSDLPERVAAYIQRHQLLAADERVVVGVSGGPDSLCLLDVLRKLGYRPVVAHLDHRLRGEAAAADARFVEALAAEWGLPFHGGREDVAALAQRRRLNLEEAARQARYAFLADAARTAGAGKIAVGHNADDQVETVLMHFLRGTGLAGLRGMLPATPLDAYRFLQAEAAAGLTLIRPLLDTPRAEIEAYCRAQGLQPRFDRSNLDTTFYRNRLRHELLPLLKTYNPNIGAVLGRSAQVIAAEFEVLQAQLASIWVTVVRRETAEAIIFDLPAWRRLPLAWQRSTLRQAIHRLRPGLRNIDFGHVERAVRGLARAESGLKITLPQGLLLTVSYDTFVVAAEGFAGPEPDFPHLTGPDPVPVSVPGRTPLPGAAWALQVEELPAEAVSPEMVRGASGWRCYLDADAVGGRPRLRPRAPGDRFQPLGLNGRSQRVNEFMINARVPAPDRARIPLLVSAGGEICWICGWRVDHRARVTPATHRVLSLRFEAAPD